jgi:predicted RNA-binding protein
LDKYKSGAPLMSKEKQSWLCIVNSENFEIISKKKIYGVPERQLAKNRLAQIKEGDILLFYVVSPVCRILGKSSALSSIYTEEDKSRSSDL